MGRARPRRAGSRVIHRALDAGIDFVDTADALDAGIDFVDTADAYSRGESEEIVGKALAGGRRVSVVLATKFHGTMGDDLNECGNSRRWIFRAVEASLTRLQTDWIDLYQVHRWDHRTDHEETLGALNDLVSHGRVSTRSTRAGRTPRSRPRRGGGRQGGLARSVQPLDAMRKTPHRRSARVAATRTRTSAASVLVVDVDLAQLVRVDVVDEAADAVRMQEKRRAPHAPQ